MTVFRIKLRFLLVAGLLAAGTLFALATQLPAQAPSPSARAAEIARLRYKLFERVDYPLAMRHLKTEIKLLDARVASLQRRLKEAERFYRSNALFTATEKLRLELLEAELVLADRKHELLVLQTYKYDERRLHQLLVAP